MYSDECDCAKARICRRSMGRERKVCRTAGSNTDDSSLKSTRMLKYSSTTSSTVLRAEMGMYPLQTNRGVRKLKWQHKARNMPKRCCQL